MLLERDEQLTTLSQALLDAPSSGGKVVLIRGPAGIGKSALVREFMARVGGEAHTHIGYCDDLSTPQPLGPFWDIAEDVPALTRAVAAGDRLDVMLSVLDVLTRKLRPTVLIIEDTQWAGAATLDVIKYVGRRISRTNGLLILTYRDTELERLHPLRLVIGDISPTDLLRLNLGPLSLSAIGEMARESGLDPNALAELTGGNPLFVAEVVRSGLEGVPSSVRDSVIGRASKLPDAVHEVLDLMSVVPGEIEIALLLHLRPAAGEAIEEAERAGLTTRGTKTAWFTHELMRRAIEAELSPESRLLWNREVLHWLIASDGDPIRIVHHARETGDGAAIRAHAPAAAKSAMAVGSYIEAVEVYRTLGPTLDESDDSRLVELFEDWAEAEFHADGRMAQSLIQRAINIRRAAGEEAALARDLQFAMELHQRRDEIDKATICMREAMELVEANPGSREHVRALGRHSWLAMRQGAHELALELADRALFFGGQLEDETAVIEALNVKGTIVGCYGEKQGLRYLDDARARAERANDAVGQIRALTNMALCAYLCDDGKLAKDYGRRMLETARRHEHPLGHHIGLQVMAEVLLNTGDWAEAEALAIEALSVSEVEVPITARMVLALLAIRVGRPDAEELVTRLLDHVESTGDVGNQVHVGVGLAEFLWVHDLDRPDVIDRLQAIEARTLEFWDHKPPPPLSFRLWMLGHPSVDPKLLPDPYRLAIGGHIEESADYWEQRGFPFNQALTLVFGTNAQLVEALRIFEKLEARPFTSRTRGILTARGAPVPRGLDPRTEGHPAGLTPRQDEVLQLLGEGLTDNEIADRLFLSPRTVHHHVSAVLGKLGAANRTEAVSIAISSGLIRQAI